MIQQQYYTRERRGIFSRTPGYDTVAKSKELNKEFIINTLHDLCFYEAPALLAGEEDILKYPNALFCVNTEDNQMVVGQSVFAGKDYTGERNRYFTHSYIIPKEEKEKYLENPERIIYSTGFARDYSIEGGMIIPEVSDIGIRQDEEGFNSIEEMFSAVGIDSELFVYLIKACFDGAKFGKKIYIVLDLEDSNITLLAKGVLKYLYRVLPFEVRRKIGFITYMKEPKIKDLINIIFLCKGSIKRLTTEIKAGYVFDIGSKNFYLDGIDEEKHIFFDFIMENIENVEKLNEFLYKADKLHSEDRLDLCKYDNLLESIEENKKNIDDIQNGERRTCIKTSEKVHKELQERENSSDKKASSFPIWNKLVNFIKRIKDSLVS
ncbi:hypothetical protein [Clostridium sp. DJ247]|uniref:GAP1-N2 domain-containing protein n=1 Tax=Clostridium sp. DJ247 TaxID=2726188 RepID=UPI00162A6370|nr:hypothetical protein [Clostridium sp. DJ247]MBC2582821.1 hypothetical protein [Clostridium sp. DJ247]